MKIREYMEKLYAETDAQTEHYVRTCDTLKAGNPEAELTKAAVTMFATGGVLRAAAEWGANLLIVHEPVFYRHLDDPAELETLPDPVKKVIAAKRRLIGELGITIYRYHDHPHYRVPDLISEGQTANWGLKGQWKRGKYWAVNRFELEEALPVLEVAEILKEKLELRHLRLAGSRETQVKKIGLCFGTPGHVEEELAENDLVVTGEICEWQAGEYIRDLVEILGERRSLLVLGHIGSERQGMKLLAERLNGRTEGIAARYFESGEVYY